MAHSQAKKRSSSQSGSRSRQEEEEEEENHKRRKRNEDFQERSRSPISERGSKAQKLQVNLGSSKEAKRKKKEKKTTKKRRASSSSSQTTSSSSSSTSTSSSSTEESSDEAAAAKKQRHKKAARKKDKKRKKKKRKKKKEKAKKKAAKVLKEREKELKAQWEEIPGPSLDLWQKEALPDPGPALTDEQKFRIQAMKPMTKEEWDARQSVIRKVVDPETGRMRLIKGDGEVLEEIVTKERHKEINKQATRGDGLSFQMRTGMLL